MAPTVHLREAYADSYQEWKSTLAVAPTEPLEPPRTRGTFKLAEEIKNRKSACIPCDWALTCLILIPGLPVPGTQVQAALRYGMSLWGEACKIETLLPSGERRDYLLKVRVPLAFRVLSRVLTTNFASFRSCPTIVVK